ncbi:MAG: T9SS type A sorting domain-containing protein, partial [Actinomycetota bacterium]|nr:T9SS type A sorting domain-containing protein [Actinomycetota bacterium]
TNLAVLNEIIYPEPGQSYQLNAVISGTASHDPLMPTPSGILEVFPNVLGPASSGRITLKYAGGNAFSQPMDIRLYDLRGRLLEQYELSSSHELVVDLPRLGSGIYFLSAFSGGRMLGRQKLTVIK